MPWCFFIYCSCDKADWWCSNSYNCQIRRHSGRHCCRTNFTKTTKFCLSQTLNSSSDMQPLPLDRERRNACRVLFSAALRGDWETAKLLIDKDSSMICAKLTPAEDTVLHIAATAKCTAFVKELVNRIGRDDMALQNKHGDTAFLIATASGVVEIVEIMVNKNNELLSIRNKGGWTPLLKAAASGHNEMVRYLYPLVNFDQLARQERIKILLATISLNIYDIAMEILKKDPTLAYARDGKNETALNVLARNPSPIASGSGLGIIKRYIGSWIYKEALTPTLAHQLVVSIWEQVQQLEEEISRLIRVPSNVLFDAAISGNVEFFTVILHANPYLNWEHDAHWRSVFHVAVLHRQENIFNIIHKIGAVKDYLVSRLDENGNNILHLAGMLPPEERLGSSRANLQMQRELLWFKEVEKIVPPSYNNMKNKEGKTPRNIFNEQHRNLLTTGGTSTKEIANSCMLVATLISTVVFAAALTVPGASNGDSHSHTPIFRKEVWFIIFIVSNGLALFSSAASIILLLSILTSRFTEREYITSLHARLMFGLTTLFISITSMVIAFAAAVFLIFDYKSAWVSYFIALLACVPVILFLVLHYNLWADLIRGAYWSKYLFQPSKYEIY